MADPLYRRTNKQKVCYNKKNMITGKTPQKLLLPSRNIDGWQNYGLKPYIYISSRHFPIKY